VEGELHQPAPHALVAHGQHGVPADEPVWLVQGDGEGQARFEGRVAGGDVVPPTAVALLQPEGVERVVAGGTTTGTDDGVVDVGGDVSGHQQLPTELTHVGDARGADEAQTEIDLSRLAK